VKPLFVTGAHTGVGKTYISALLVRRWKAKALKPVISGFTPGESDCSLLIEAMDGGLIEEVSPWRFTAPLAPNVAARREGKSIDFDALVAFCRKPGPLVIEGVGGVMAPITDTKTVLDWIEALGVPTLLVTGSYLGALSHTLTAARALKEPLAIVVSQSEDCVGLEETVATLKRLAPCPVFALTRLDPAEQVGLREMADLDAFLRQRLAD
jgi:dethiobiotin synthetase